MNVPIKVVGNDRYTWQAQFKIDQTLFQFVADMEEDLDFDEPEDWGVTFWNKSKTNRFGLGSTEITGDFGTSSLKVFSGVASAFKKFIQAKKPDMFFFSAEEKSRVRLYNRFAKMIAKETRYNMEKSLEDGDYLYQFTRK